MCVCGDQSLFAPRLCVYPSYRFHRYAVCCREFAYTVSLILGAKITTDGFYTADVIEHLTQAFSLEALKEGEAIAITEYEWDNFWGRLRTFRNALASVALEDPLPVDRPTAALPPIVGLPALPEPHVLIVDDDPATCELHRSLTLAVQPNSTVHIAASASAAAAYLRQSHSDGVQIDLILLDLCLSPAVGAAGSLDDVRAAADLPLIRALCRMPE